MPFGTLTPAADRRRHAGAGADASGRDPGRGRLVFADHLADGHTRNIWDCVVAHAVTNLLLGVYVVATGEWQFL